MPHTPFRWPNRITGCLLTLAWTMEPDALFASGGHDDFVVTIPIWLATLPATVSAAGSYLWLMQTCWPVTIFSRRYRDARVPAGASPWSLDAMECSGWIILLGVTLVGWARADQATATLAHRAEASSSARGT